MTPSTFPFLALAVMFCSMPRDGGAQRSVVVPKWKSPEKAKYLFADFDIAASVRNVPVHSQYVYDIGEIGVPSARMVAVAFRDSQAFVISTPVFPAVRFHTSVFLSHGPFVPMQAGVRFDKNAGKDITEVFKGWVSWPRKTMKTPSAFVARIPFQRPFSFDKTKGKSLVMDIETDQPVARTGIWICATAGHDGGNIYFNDRVSCWIRYRQLYWASLSPFPGKLEPGGAMEITWFNIPPNALCFASIGSQGVGGKWGAHTLPIVLANGCHWAASSFLFWGFTTDQQGKGHVPNLPIPMHPGVIGMRFFDQCGCLTPKLNSLGLVTFFTQEWQIGSGHTPNASYLLRTNNNPRSPYAGWFARGSATIARFEYQ